MRTFGTLNGSSAARRSILTQAGLRYFPSPVYVQQDTGYPYSTYGSLDYGVDPSKYSLGGGPQSFSLGGSTSTPASGYRYSPYMPTQQGWSAYGPQYQSATNRSDVGVGIAGAVGQIGSSLVTGIFGLKAAKAGAAGASMSYAPPPSTGPNLGLIVGAVAVTALLGTGLFFALRS